MTVPLPAIAVPVAAAPMAGGPSTPQLVAAVTAAGGFGFLAGGYLSVDALAERIGDALALLPEGAAYGVNLFVPASRTTPAATQDEATRLASYRHSLRPDAQRLRVPLREADWSDTDAYDEKVTLLEAVAPAVVSFTFGCPTAADVGRLHAAGSCVAVTVTDAAEARAAVGVGADALVVQGFEAGGHRGTHSVAATPNALDHLALIETLAPQLPNDVALVAAGGITTSGDVRRALDAGATWAAAGTAFLLSPEAGTSAAHRLALSDPAMGSVITRAFSGRPARGLRNRFVDNHDSEAPAIYPQVHQLTSPLRAAAARQGDLGGIAAWAGSGWRAAQEAPAAEIVAGLTP